MEAPTHYVEATILPLDSVQLSGADISFATTAIMGCVHLAIVEGAEIAVSFPKMSSDQKVATTGSVVRIFGSVLDLAKLLARKDFASLNAGGMFRLGKESIRIVPSDVQWEIYRRDRSVERSFDGFNAREVRHCENKGLPQAMADRPKMRRDRLPFVRMKSASTGENRFSLFIRRQSADAFVSGKPSTYGLGVAVPAF
jgi:CRISPR-associated endoribonuclease Cas6/Csy4 subtype I-F